LKAARAARQAIAFETGLNYAKAGIELLGENSWDQDYRLTLELQEQAALLAHAAGDIPAMEHHSEQVLQFGRDPLDLARVQRMRMEFLTASNRLDESLELGLETLRILGQEFPPNPDWEFAAAKVAELNDRIERENPDFLSIPPLNDQDPQFAASAEIMTAAATAAYMFHPALCPLIIERNLELCLTRQLLPPSSPWIIAAFGVYVSSLLGKNEAGFAYGETAVRLAEKVAFRSFMSSALYHHAAYLHFWHNPLRETLDVFMRSIKIGHDYGNNEFIAYSSKAWPKHALCASIDIGRVVEQATQLRAFLDAVKYDMQSRWLNVSVTAALALRGNSLARGIIWRGTPFDDDRNLPYMQQTGDQFGLLTTYSAKAWVATLFGDHEGAEQYSELACSVLEAGTGMLENAIVAFVCGLRYAREQREDPDRPESEQALEKQLGLLERFAGLAPMNFAHKFWLVQAEVHRARGEVLPAMQAYEKASQGARENDYLNEAGLAHALAVEFYQDLGLHQAALHNAEQAAQAWRSWGAHALVESLSQR
ncbi:MAG: hypothetical protein KAI25_07200, partial [Hyphomicrobiaceae bacterium]|nr:hypothetical protein [Hyphomicrobiaceae bacterium]